MKLHENKALFKQFVEGTFNYFNHLIPKIYIIRDYYITNEIKTIMGKSANISLKGGIAMAKVYEGFPIRESRDIDFNAIDKNKRYIDAGVLGFNPEYTYAHLDKIKVDDLIGAKFDRKIAVSISYVTNSNHIHEAQINTLIGIFLAETGFEAKCKEFGLLPFDVNVDNPEKIFVDKVCALCEIWKKSTEGFIKDGGRKYKSFDGASRHLVDLYILAADCRMENLSRTKFQEIKTQMYNESPHSFSILSDYDFKTTLKEIANSEILKSDFENITKKTMFDKELANDFESLKSNLIKIADSEIFDKQIKKKPGLKTK